MNTPSLDPLGQMIAKYHANGLQPLATTQPAVLPSSNKKKRTWTGFSDKTLWDWLHLLGVLAVPLVVTLLPLIYTNQQMQLQLDQQQATTLKTAMDDISDLLLHEGLYTSLPVDEVRVIARVKALTAFSTLDPGRKRALLRFLYQAKLIGGSDPAIVSLEGADLTDAHLNGANLSGADLQGTNLEGADLSRVDLNGANLSGADLRNANVTKDQLASASILKNATLPDGSYYPSQSYLIPNHTEP
jgi:hypothetical protein